MIYIPDRGDVIWINFDPQVGREQAKHRPALVLTRKRYNHMIGLCVVCPITSKKKNYPFEIPILTSKIEGAILTDQVKSIDWAGRQAKFIDRVSEDVLQEVKELLSTLIF